MERFNRDYTIGYSETGSNLKLSLSGLMEYVLETTLLHTKNAGYSMEWFGENKKAFVIASWNIEVYDFPKWNDKIKIRTWPSMFKGVLGDRSFEVEDEKGEILLKADSRWMYSDFEKNLPERISKEMSNNFGDFYPPHFDKKVDFDNLDGYEIISTNEYKVRRSDIDSNKHVNNISYIRWALDNLDDEIVENNTIKSMDIRYKKECLQNDLLIIENYKKDNNIKTIIKKDDEIRTVLISEWQ